MSDIRIRECSVCSATFESPRTNGRPVEICSDTCRRVAHRRRQREYLDRLLAAREQLSHLRAA